MTQQGTPMYRPFKQGVLFDLFALSILFGVLFCIVTFVSSANSQIVSFVQIDSNLASLPKYAVFTIMRGFVALVVSFVVAIILGKIASQSDQADNFLISALDMLQSLPVLAFMPGFVLTFISIFNSSRWGLELSCVLVVVTGQIWNLTSAYYESLRTMPKPLLEASAVHRFSAMQQFLWLDLPQGIRPLIYNGMMSMAGGWFYLILCESFVLDHQKFQLPGLGSYLSQTLDQEQYYNFGIGIGILILIILSVDFFFWRPLYAWSERFQDEKNLESLEFSTFLNIIEYSHVPKLIKFLREKILKLIEPLLLNRKTGYQTSQLDLWTIVKPLKKVKTIQYILSAWRSLLYISGGFLTFQLLPYLPDLGKVVSLVTPDIWSEVLRGVFHTFYKVFAVLIMSTLWTLPLGLLIGFHKKIALWVKPFVQNLAAFPFPVLYPLFIIYLKNRDWPPFAIAIFLMAIGNQWHLLLHTILGTRFIREEYFEIAETFHFSKLQKFRWIYFPAILPSLTSGWITAAAGAWNASIVAEWVHSSRVTFHTEGVGAILAVATATGDYPRLIAGIIVTSITLILLNRTLWKSLHRTIERVKA